jgi:hypothetical protein
MRHSNLLQTPSSTATADVAITLTMPTNLATRLLALGPSNRSIVSEAYWEDSTANVASLLMAAVEYKKFKFDDGYRQLVFDLSTAHSAWKALGLTEVPLYGWTSSRSSEQLTMHLHASWWVSCRLSMSVGTCPQLRTEQRRDFRI